MNVSPGVPYYFATWTGYDPPVKPHNAIDYPRAEASNAFSVFVFDEKGRVVSFEKWLATTTKQDATLLADRRLPVGPHFFAVARDSSEHPGDPLSLEDTKSRADYYRARVGAQGRVDALERVHRERMIRHDYTYWENGRLREARFEPDTQPGGIERYDRDGKRLVPN